MNIIVLVVLVAMFVSTKGNRDIQSMEHQIMQDAWKIDQLNRKVTNLLVQVAENKYKDELVNSLRETINVQKEKCEAKGSESVLGLQVTIKDLKKLVSTYKNQLDVIEELNPLQQRVYNKELQECRSQLFVIQKLFNGHQSHGTGTENAVYTLGTVDPNSCVSYGDVSDTRLIYLPGSRPIYVLCDSTTVGPGWIVIQRRLDGSENFYRSWAEYRSGFGNYRGEFFIGLEKLHQITNYKPCELYIYLEKFTGIVSHAYYDNFVIGDESSKYRLLELGAYSGTAGDFLRSQENSQFSTYDSDNDNWSDGNVAEKYHGGWWYIDYVGANLNGRYIFGDLQDRQGLHWEDLTTHKTVIMLIRPKY